MPAGREEEVLVQRQDHLAGGQPPEEAALEQVLLAALPGGRHGGVAARRPLVLEEALEDVDRGCRRSRAPSRAPALVVVADLPDTYAAPSDHCQSIAPTDRPSWAARRLTCSGVGRGPSGGWMPNRAAYSASDQTLSAAEVLIQPGSSSCSKSPPYPVMFQSRPGFPGGHTEAIGNTLAVPIDVALQEFHRQDVAETIVKIAAERPGRTCTNRSVRRCSVAPTRAGSARRSVTSAHPVGLRGEHPS